MSAPRPSDTGSLVVHRLQHLLLTIGTHLPRTEPTWISGATVRPDPF